MWLKWLPWRFIVKKVAKSSGLMDPFSLLSKLSRFSQPSEVMLPIELVRAGSVFHARGLINSRVIQHNLDWVWPFWIQKQFDPNSKSFIPRAYSLTHINLTHRNWTAVGAPGIASTPIVDPRGLVMPFFDSWCVDGWLIAKDGEQLYPSKTEDSAQELVMSGGLEVVSRHRKGGLFLESRVKVIVKKGRPYCRINYIAEPEKDAWIAISVRPFNPEGISFVHNIKFNPENISLKVNEQRLLECSEFPEIVSFSNYRNGDVKLNLFKRRHLMKIKCDVGMASAAVLFSVKKGTLKKVGVEIPLQMETEKKTVPSGWDEALSGKCKLKLPDKNIEFLFNAAVRTVYMFTEEDVYAGPFTYRRFWFRDAAFILNALLSLNFKDRAGKIIEGFPKRQTPAGYFRSQKGEWDSNGQVLWIISKYCKMTGAGLSKKELESVRKGAEWIEKKRTDSRQGLPHSGLLPAGFSAEHLGPNDYYYWDDFWGVAGLVAANEIENLHYSDHGRRYMLYANQFMKDILRSLRYVLKRIGRPAMPASPYRRLDSGAIGSIAAGYPLELFSSNDPALLDTAEYLYSSCFVNGLFFHDMTHSGINAYLSLHVAEVFLRAGDERFYGIIKKLAEKASPTGQWPEAIHPQTGGGCMGDGQHVWAASEWIVMIRNCFVREGKLPERLILCSGVVREWIGKETVEFGPAPTSWGDISITVKTEGDEIIVSWKGVWRQDKPEIEVSLPGFKGVRPVEGENRVRIKIR